MTTLGTRPTRQRGASGAGAGAKQRRPRAFDSTRTAVRSAWDAPVTSYYLIGSVTLVLLALGLVFVLSSSTIDQLADDKSPLGVFIGQARFALIGLPLAFAASRLPVKALNRLAWPAYALALGFQVLAIFFGATTGGNITGVDLGFIYFQPAEFGKLGLAVWLGAVLAAKQHQLGELRHVALPVAGAALMIAVQLYTHDLGTALVLGALVAGALFVAGLPLRIFAAVGVPGLAVVAFLATQGESRMDRIMALVDPASLDPDGLGLQPKVALWALGTGGVSGVGLGGSRTKWLYLPEAHNDFILAIVGEELGLLGTLLVLGLFALLIIGLTRVVVRHPNPFVKITTAAIATWIAAQAIVNIGVVINVLPVIGIPLPLLSAGGSSLIATLIAIGIVLSFARDEPGARAALLARRGSVRRSIGVMARRGPGFGLRATRGSGR